METLEHEASQYEMVNPSAPGPETMRLAQALVHDLRASLHGLSLALEMVRDGIGAEANQKAQRYIGMASAEAISIDHTIEQLGLWVRIVGDHYRPRIDRVDLRSILEEQHNPLAHLPSGPVWVYADRHLLIPALDGILSFMKACAVPGEEPRADLTPQGQIIVRGPEHWLPVLRTVVSDPVPNLQASRGPAKWLIGLALAVTSCRSCGGQVSLEGSKDRCELTLQWRRH